MKITTIPNVYRNVNRWGEILTILSKYGLADWVSRFDLALVKGFLKNRDGEKLAHLSRETRIRMAIEELGPTFIKLGQILSTRPDQVGMPLAQELQKLQTERGVRRTASRARDDRGGTRTAAGNLVCRFRYDATGIGFDRAGAPRTAALGRRRRREGAARGHPPADGSRPRYSGRSRAAGREAAGAAVVSAAGDRGRVPPHRAARVRFRARSAQPAAVRTQLRRLAARADSAALPEALDRPRDDDGMARRREAVRPASCGRCRASNCSRSRGTAPKCTWR